jgi:hypothetical protein
MDNIDPKTVQLQTAVVDKFNKSNYEHYTVKANLRHGAFMDYFWCLNGVNVISFANAIIERKVDHDVILFLDIDCVPLNEDAIDHYINMAANGLLVGNIQRSNHIENNQHVFAAPSAVALSKETFIKMGKPSALENHRSDVAEEYTWAAEENGVGVDLYLPLSYDRKPTECDYWPLKDGMPVYGQGTTFGRDNKPMFYHNFQIFHPGQQQNFWNKCEEILNGSKI